MGDQTGSFVARARGAQAAMRGAFEPTPLQRNAYLSARYGADVWLKREDLSPVRSYKIRGAFNAMRKADAALYVCASAGNHAQGVAWNCARSGAEGTIFMPVTTPRQKIDKTLAFGQGRVRVELTGDYYDQSQRAARAYAAEAGAHFLSPFDDADVIEGQASVALEAADQMEAAGEGPADLVVLPVGGGGLAAGMRRALAALWPGAALRLVEPSGGASLAAALVAGAPVDLPRVDGFVDGAAVGRVGERTFAALGDLAPSQVIAAPEDRICVTMLEMLQVEGIVLEPAGALAIDALRDLAARGEIEGRRVVCVTSGGNFDFERLAEVRERAARFAGLKKYFVLRLPQRPGALREFLDLLGPGDDIARFEYLKKSARNFGTVLIGIEASAPGDFAALLRRVAAAGYEMRDITGDESLAQLLV